MELTWGVVGNGVSVALSYHPTEPETVAVSALTEQGLDRLKTILEDEVVRSTGKLILNLEVDLSSAQLRRVGF